MIYADSSFLVSAFGSDANSEEAVNLLAAAEEPLAMISLHRLEIANAWELAVFRGRQTRAEVESAAQQMLRAVRAKSLVAMPVAWEVVLRSARRLAQAHTATMGNRSYDIMHVAAARHLRLNTFFSFDKRQRTLASHLGMSVEPRTLRPS